MKDKGTSKTYQIKWPPSVRISLYISTREGGSDYKWSHETCVMLSKWEQMVSEPSATDGIAQESTPSVNRL